jgi:putative tryptophan/tyrosine transport system substrate-binding protein
MNRRGFMTLLGGAVAPSVLWPLVARAQQAGEARRIAVLMGSATTELGRSYLATFLRRLEQLGWADGRNARIETRWWTGTLDEMGPVVSELLAFSPDVIMAFSNPAVALLKPRAGHIPIVFAGVGDPIGDGFVASLAHPGGNITGFAGTDGPIGGKWLEVLKDTAPRISRVMMLMHPETPIHQAFWRSFAAAAPRFGVEATAGGVHDAAQIERAISSFAARDGAKDRAKDAAKDDARDDAAIIVNPHALTWANEDLIIALTLRHRLPAHFATAASVKAGGLVCYGHDFEDAMRRTAEYVDRILRGEKPGDLPVQMPTKFRLVFNLKTAKLIGLDIPSTTLARADEVIE